MNIKATITQGGKTTAKVTPQQSILVTSYRSNQNITNLGDISDVNVGALTDGSMLAYNSATQKWEATTLLENPSLVLNGGFF